MNNPNLNGHAVSFEVKPVEIGDCGVLGPSYTLWRRIQHGQEEVIRWHMWRQEYPQLRRQNGYQHELSITALVDEKARLMTEAGFPLDREMLLRCAKVHDIGEGLLGVDVAAPRKTDLDDLKEYLAFRQVFKVFGDPVWLQLECAFLLQTCIKNPECFPDRARRMMDDLAKTHRREALFFKGIEMLDYLYYAHEGAVENGVVEILRSVSARHIPALDKIASELPGFGDVVWTPEIRSYFDKAAAELNGDPLNGDPKNGSSRQFHLFEMEG